MSKVAAKSLVRNSLLANSEGEDYGFPEQFARSQYRGRVRRVVGTVGEVLALYGYCVIIVIDASLFADRTSSKVVSGIDLDAGLGGEYAKGAAAGL